MLKHWENKKQKTCYATFSSTEAYSSIIFTSFTMFPLCLILLLVLDCRCLCLFPTAKTVLYYTVMATIRAPRSKTIHLLCEVSRYFFFTFLWNIYFQTHTLDWGVNSKWSFEELVRKWEVKSNFRKRVKLYRGKNIFFQRIVNRCLSSTSHRYTTLMDRIEPHWFI